MVIGSMIKAKCRRCGQEAPADEFKMHYSYRMMVCPNCFRGEKEKIKVESKVEERAGPPKPAGWDKEDEYLERMSHLKKQQVQGWFRRVPGQEHLLCTCASCKYSFKYDPHRKVPSTCPYCNGPIPGVGASKNLGLF